MTPLTDKEADVILKEFLELIVPYFTEGSYQPSLYKTIFPLVILFSNRSYKHNQFLIEGYLRSIFINQDLLQTLLKMNNEQTHKSN